MPTYSIEGPDGKTYSIDGPAGATREEVIRAIQMRMSAQPVERPAPAQMPIAPQAPSTQRSFGEAALDIPAAALSGLGSLLQFPGQVAKMVPGLTGVGQALEKPGELVSEAGDYLKSEGLKAREALRSKAISEAEKDGVLSAFGTAIVSTIKDPALITTFLAEQVPLLLGPAGAAKLTQKLGAKAVESAGAGLTGDAAKEAVKVASEKLSKKAYGAAYGTGAAMQAADVSSDAYDEALRKAREMGLSEEEAQSKALAAGRVAGLGAGTVSLLAQRLPGAKAIEQRLSGVPGTAGKLGSAVGEGISEAIEEGGGQVFKNLGLRQVDPNQSLLEGVGGAAGLGALGGGTLGGILGKKAEEPRFEGQREGESDREFAARLQREIQQGIQPPAPPPAPPKIPTDQQLFTLAAQPNGYGLLENLKQRLSGDQTISEEERNAVVDNIRSIQERMTVEEIERKRVTPGAEERFLRPEILTSDQLFDMAAKGGYGQLESYKQDLLQVKQDTEIKNTIKEIEDLQRRMNIEQVQRLQPVGAPPGPLLPTDTEAQQKAQGMELNKLDEIVKNMGQHLPVLQGLIADPESLKKKAKKDKLSFEDAQLGVQDRIEYINSVLPVYTQVLQQRKQQQQQTKEAEKAQEIANLTPEQQAVRAQAEALIKELEESGVPEFVASANGFKNVYNNNNFKTEKDIEFLKSKVESYRKLKQSAGAAKPVDEINLEFFNKDYPDDLARIQEASKDPRLADLFTRINDVMGRGAKAINALGMSWSGVDARSPLDIQEVKRSVGALGGGVGQLTKIKQAIDKNYDRPTNDPAKLERAITEIEEDIETANQRIAKVQALAPVPAPAAPPAPAPAEAKAPGTAVVPVEPVRKIEGPKPKGMPVRAKELPQPKAPVTEDKTALALLETNLARAERKRNAIINKGDSLWTVLVGKLNPLEVNDINPERRFKVLQKKGGGGDSISTFVANGDLDPWLPPDRRLGMTKYDEYDNTEYVKELLRGGKENYLTFDTKAEAEKIFGSILEMESAIKDILSVEEANEQLEALRAEFLRGEEERTVGEIEADVAALPARGAPEVLGGPKGEVIDVEARVVEETLGPKVAALPAPQIATLEKHYGVDKDSPTFLQRIKEDVVLYATKGGKAVAAIIRPIIRNLHAAVLSLAVIFNPTNISPAEAVVFDKQVITETKDIRVAPPESVASKMSPGAQEAYSILYPSIKDQLQRDNKLMLIVDKPRARMFVFTPDGQPLLDKKVLLGKATGDLYKGNNDLPQNRITPAGLFKMGLRDADRSIGEARTAGEYDFKKVFVLDKAIEGEYSVTLFHSVWLKESDAALRAKALKSESETDSRYSFGCINVDKQTYERLITDHLNQMDGASLFIVPDNAAATAEFLTGATAQNVSGADGLTRTTFTPAKETVAYEVKRAGRPGELMREVSRTPVKKSLAKVAKGVSEAKFKELERRAKAAPEVKAEEAPKEEAPAVPEISPEIQAKIDMLKKVLQKNLSKFGLKDVDLNLEQGMADEGSFSGQLIRIALDSPDPLGILRHESVHALKDAGFFTDKQWATLERTADEKWIDQFLKGQEVEYEGQRMSRYDAYMKEYGGNTALIREEAIADAFRSFSKKKPAGLMGTLTERMKNFFKAVKSAFNSQGFESAEDIFGKIEEGKLEAAPVKAEGVESRASLRTSDIQKISKAPEAECFSNARKYASDNDEPGTFVVHGKVNDINGKVIDHAWVERNESVIDPTAGVIVPKNVYYPQVSAIAESVYTPEQASINSVRTGNQGPWTAEEVGNRIVERKSLRAPNTEAFKKWFGDSKVVDANGEPMVMYHGTSKTEGGEAFTKFDTYASEYGLFGQGSYFTDNPEVASSYTKKGRGPAPTVYPVYLSIKNPIDMDAPADAEAWGKAFPDVEFEQEVPKGGTNEQFYRAAEQYIIDQEMPKYEGAEMMQEALRSMGHDGVTHIGGGRVQADGVRHRVYIAFDPEQVKSSTGNIGTFEPTSPDIRKSLRASDDRFNSKEIDEMRVPGYKSKEKLIEMPISDFLQLAENGYNEQKMQNARQLLADGKQFSSIPFLAVERADENTPSIYKTVGHEGRHRARALEELGYKTMPVILKTDFIRWSEQNDPEKFDYREVWPSRLDAQEKATNPYFSIPFPVRRGDSEKPYGEVGPKGVEKLSMRSMPVIDPAIDARVNATIRPRKKEGFVERMIDAISAKTFSRFREELINHYNEFAEVDKRVAAQIKAMGGAQQLADEKAEVAALFSDQAAAVASSALGSHNRKGGVPVYKNGVVTVDTSGDNEGPVVIFAPLASTGDPKTFQHYQFWAAVNRAKKYIQNPGQTRYVEQTFEKDDIELAERLRAEYARQGIDFKDIQKRWNKYNNGLVKLMRDTGTISERAARDFMEHADYFPFYRQVNEEEMTGPKTFSTIAGTKPPKAAKGSEEPLGDFFETVIRNTQAAITLAMKNVAAQRATSQALRIDEVVRLSESPQIVQTGANTWDVLDSQYADTITAADQAAALTAARAKYGANATVDVSPTQGKWNVFKPTKIGEVDAPNAQEARQIAFENHKYRPDVFVYKVLENGQPVYYRAYDIKFINALKALNTTDLPFLGLLSAPANALRTLVTKEPGYMLVNQMRDSLSAWVTSGVKMTPVIDSARQFAKSVAKISPEMEALFNAGVIGGYEYAHGARESGAFLEKEIRRKAGVKSVTEKITTPFTSLWGALERGTQISDGATRAEVYKRVLAETGNEAEALWQAAEVLNFYRHGRSPVIRVLTAAIPFLNSRIQGLDVLYRAGMRPALDKMSTDEQRQRMKTFWTRGMTMMAVSAMYWMLTHDDDEYKKQEQETRDNYWLVPSLGIKIAIPFEVGVLFKVLPERILQNAFGTDTGKESLESFKRQLQSTLMFTFIPQALLPYYEVATNFSFFTQRPIIGKGMEDVAPRFQVSPGTSSLAQLMADKLRIQTTNDSSAFTKSLASQLEISPIKLDHMIKGYTGTIGQYAVELFDAIYNMNNDVPKPSKRFEQLPVIKRLALDPNARGTVTSYYDLKNAVDEVTRTSNLLERTMNAEEYGAYLRQNIGILANKEYVSAMEKSMKELRDAKTLIRFSKMDEDRKRDAILSIEKMENQLTSNIQTVRKKAYD